MLRSGRIRASTPSLICSTGISWPGCGARVTSCSPVRKYPAPGTKAQTLVVPSTTSSTWLVLGARRVDIGQTGAESWTVLADPEGNEFCVVRPKQTLIR
jgi:hypothetical protein